MSKTRTPIEKRKVPPATPAWLGEDGRECWNDTIRILMEKGNVEDIDLRIIGIYCREWEKYRACDNADLDDDARKHGEMVIKVGQLFGATPKARLRIVSKKKDKAKDADEDILAAFGAGDSEE